MEAKFLTDELDRIPYFSNDERLSSKLSKIDDLKAKINKYFEIHPKAKEEICGTKSIELMLNKKAMSYLSLDDSNDKVGIVASSDMDETQKEIYQQILERVADYKKAFMYVYDEAVKYKTEDWKMEKVLLVAHQMLKIPEEYGNNISSLSFRTGRELEIGIANGWFKPVDGYDVASRVSLLLYMNNEMWSNDHPIVRAAKFFTEYYRIQPHVNGNKRTAILGMNFMLAKAGYPLVSFEESDKKAMISSLEEAMLTRDVSALAELIADNIYQEQREIAEEIECRKLDKFVEKLNKKIEKENDEFLKQVISDQNEPGKGE